MSGYSSPTIGNLGIANEPGFVAPWVAVILAAVAYDGVAVINYAAIVNAAVAADAVFETVVSVNKS